jgi:hypothetical protein
MSTNVPELENSATVMKSRLPTGFRDTTTPSEATTAIDAKT